MMSASSFPTAASLAAPVPPTTQPSISPMEASASAIVLAQTASSLSVHGANNPVPPKILQTLHENNVTEQESVSLEDSVVKHLHDTGALNAVAGSQSVLSQELLQQLSQPSSSQESQEEEEEDSVCAATTAKEMAQRFGILSQDENALPRPTDSNAPISVDEEEALAGLDAMKQAATTLRIQQQEDPKALLQSLTKRKRHSSVGGGRLQQQPISVGFGFGSLLHAANAVITDVGGTGTQSSNNNNNNNLTHMERRQLRQFQAQRLAAGKSLYLSSPAKAKKPARKRASSKKQTKNKVSKKHPLLASPTVQVNLDPDEVDGPLELMAKTAAIMAKSVSKDADLEKRLLLSMALVRDNPRGIAIQLKEVGHVLKDGFFWAHYPPLENILKNFMAQYYELSMSKCQSAAQHEFNNCLVTTIRKEVAVQRWEFDTNHTDKFVRDRIRCYYKTRTLLHCDTMPDALRFPFLKFALPTRLFFLFCFYIHRHSKRQEASKDHAQGSHQAMQCRALDAALDVFANLASAKVGCGGGCP